MDQTKSPQFVEGMKNREYRNPTFQSHCLPDATSPGKVRGRDDTSYKDHYPKFEYNASHQRREVATKGGNRRERSEISRQSDAVSAKSQLTDNNVSYRTRSSKASNHVKINPVVQLQPMDARELRPAGADNRNLAEEMRDRGNSRDVSDYAGKSPLPNENYVRSLKRKDTGDWQNPTYKSTVLQEEQKHNVPARSSKNWESTAHHDFEMTHTLMKGEKESQKGESAKKEDLPAYKAWRRQQTEPLQTPYKYAEEYEQYGELPSPQRRMTKQPQDALKEHFYQSPGKEATDYARDLNYRYHKDDQIFPHHVNYTGDHNAIIHDEEAIRLYKENSVFRQVNDPRIDYTNTSIKRDTANKILAHERRAREDEEKVRTLEEEQTHLRRIAELEDRNDRLNERRRDYRVQVDDYHKVLGEERYDLSKIEKAHLAKDHIKAEAEYTKTIGEMEKLRKKEQMAWYNNELHNQIESKNRQWVRSDLLDDDLSQQHTGLKLGEYKEPSKDQLLDNLKAQVENKNKVLEKFEGVEARNTGGDFLGRKELIDKWNYQYISDHRRRNMQSTKDTSKLQELKEHAIRENAQKRRVNVVEKRSDVELINDLVVNEKQQKYEEYIRHKEKTETLKVAYNTQMKEREIKDQIEKNERRNEAKGTSFIVEGGSKFHAPNYDYRHDIQSNADRRYDNAVHNHHDDHEVINNLDK